MTDKQRKYIESLIKKVFRNADSQSEILSRLDRIKISSHIVVINNNWIVLCKRWEPWCHILFCYLYLHKEAKNLMVGSHFAMTEDKKKSTRLATNEERLMLFEEMFKYGIAFDKHVHHLVGMLVGV